MAVKSIIEVEIDDSKFKKFVSIFDDYKAALEETPDIWNEANDQMTGMVKASELLKNDAQKRLALLQSQTIEEEKAEKAQKKTADARKKREEDIAKRWKAISSAIKSSTKELSAFTQLALSGGLTNYSLRPSDMMRGFVNLTHDASYARFQSMGLGISSGAMQAANINYQSMFQNPASQLAAVREAQQDLTKQKLFITSGISNYQNKTSEQLLPELVNAVKDLTERTPKGQLAQTAQAYGFTDVFSMEDITRIGQMSRAEIAANNAKMQSDAKALAVGDATLKTYQDLQKQWDRFSQSMENTWIKGLEPLAPVLTKFSEAVDEAFATLMKSGTLEPLISGLGKALTDFSKYLTSSEFTDDFNAFMHWLDVAGGYIHTFAKGVGKVADALGFGSEVTLTGSQYSAIDKSFAGNKDFASAVTDYLENPSQQKDNYHIQKFAEQAEQAAKTDSQVYDKLKKLGLDIGKPLSAEDYKKQRDDEFQRMSTSYLDKLGDKTKQAFVDGWQAIKDMGAATGEAALNALIPTASAAEFPDSTPVGDKTNYAIGKLMSMGWTKEQAAGIASNLHRESGFNTSIVGDSGAAYGIAQWHGDRQRNFQKVFGKLIKGSSLDEQLAFVDWELKNTEAGAGMRLKAAKSAEDAGGIVSKYYERPRDTAKEIRERGGFAGLLARKYGGDSYAMNKKPTPDQQKSIMFQNQGGVFNTASQRVQIQVANATGGNATVSALAM